MKKYNIVLAFTMVVFCITVRVANAAPCSAVDWALINGNFALAHTSLSTKQPLAKMTVFEATQASSSKRFLGDGSPFELHNVYNVTNLSFSPGTTEDQIRLLQRISQIATVTNPKSPDLCFLVWVSSDNQFLDANVILSQNGSGDLALGSFNKLDTSLYMTLIRQPAMRR